MSVTADQIRREAIRNTLVRRAGDATDATHVAEAAASIWNQVAGRLEPVIGVQGVNALFGRSLHLTAVAFPWLDIAGELPDRSALLATVRARLGTRETAVAVEASCALLADFTELLACFIGDSLTTRLLDGVWVPPSPSPEQERA